jgi:hypothetical protein
MILLFFEKFDRLLFGLDLVDIIAPVVGGSVTPLDDDGVLALLQIFEPLLAIVEDVGLAVGEVVLLAEEGHVLLGFVGKLGLDGGYEADMGQGLGDLPESLVGRRGDVADEDIDLFALHLLDETLLVIAPVVDDALDLVGPALEVGLVEESQDVVEIEEPQLGQFFGSFFCHVSYPFQLVFF